MKIIHVDMDAFYASVEQRDNPKLRGKPVVVGGKPQGRGVVASASYEARKFGIRSAISSAQAYRLCPRAVFVKPDIQKYVRVSRQIQEIFREVTPLVEPLSLDEAYLDVTENALGLALARDVARHIKKRILEETGLTASAGVGPNKFIAKVASDFRKPNGLVVIPPEKALEFIQDLPVEKFWGVGPATAKVLHGIGLFTGADIRKARLPHLEQALGKYGHFLYGLAHGEDHRTVDPEGESKSCGTETTFDKDIRDTALLLQIVADQAQELARELRKMERPARTVTLKLRYSDFKTITRSQTLARYFDDADTIAQTAGSLLIEKTDAGRIASRLIGISVSNLYSENEPEQLCFEFP